MQDLLLALGAFAIAFVLWQFRPFSPIVYPLRLFVTFIHELGHGTAAIATGGEFLRFEVDSNGAGRAYSVGGYRPAIAAAGYMGTAIFGALLLIASNQMRYPQRMAIGLGASFAGLTVFYAGLGTNNFNILEIGLVAGVSLASLYVFSTSTTRERRAFAGLGMVLGGGLALYFAAGNNTLTLIVGVISGVLLVAIGLQANRDVNLFILNFLAFAVGLNAITDAWVLLQIVSTPSVSVHNDASSMAGAVGLTAAFWAFVWMIFAIILLGVATWLSIVRPLQRSSHNGAQ